MLAPGSRSPGPQLVALLTTALLLSGCSYHAGDQAARDFDAWVADHPLAGAKVTDRSGTNVQPFRGALEADAKLTVRPTRTSIVAAMRSMCRFDDETSARTTYWLLVGKVWLQAPCQRGEQDKVATFWDAVGSLAGVHEIDFSPKGAYLEADDDAITSLVPTISAAADRTGYAGAKTVNAYRSDRVSIDQPRGADIGRQLDLVQGVLDTAGSAVLSVRATTGLVSAATSGDVAQARTWQQQVGRGDRLLVVTPARVRTELPLSAQGRDLLDRLSTRAGVTSVVVGPSFWTIDTPRTDDARGLVTALDHEPGTHDLGRLVLDVGTTPRDPNTGEGRTCDIRPVFPERRGRAAALLDLCDQPGMTEVDDRFDILDLRLTTDDVTSMLTSLHRLPAGQEVYVTLMDNSTTDFTTGPELKPEYPQSTVGKQFVAIWRTLSATPAPSR